MKKLTLRSIIKEVIENNLAVTIYGLVKNNQGYFKSDAQATYIKSKLDATAGIIDSGEVYGNSYNTFTEFDDKGITKIYTQAGKTNKLTVKWERKQEGVLSQADQKAVRYYKREIKKLENSIASAQAAKAEFEAEGMMNLFLQRDKIEKERLQGFRDKLNQIQAN